jgi:ribosomal protein L37AE/L43A
MPEKKTYIMQRTEVLCINCLKRKLIQETAHVAYCDGCGQYYNKERNSNSYTYQ